PTRRQGTRASLKAVRLSVNQQVAIYWQVILAAMPCSLEKRYDMSHSRDRLAAQREAAVERRAAHDVGADAQPVRVQVSIEDPHLQVAGKLRVMSGQPQKVTADTAQPHLGYEEVVTGGQVHRLGEDDVELDGLPRYRTISPRVLVGQRVDAIDHEVRDNDMVVDDLGGEA